MMNAIGTTALAAVVAFSPLTLAPVAVNHHAPITVPAPAGPFDQRDFPCHEDEVLTFDPRFGPDKVGCIHIDEIGRIKR